MKIMQILPKMNLGGVERGVLDLARHFKDKFVVVSGGGRLVSELERTGAIHYTLPVYRKSLLSLILISKIREIIRKERISIVHARSRVPAWISFFASRGLDTYFITTAHGVYSRHMLSEVMGWGKFVICPSKVIARHMMNKFGVSEEKVRVINRWVDLSKFVFKAPKERRNYNTIISIGRISPTKGFEYLIEGFRKVVRNNPYATLLIVGEPDKSKTKYFSYLKSLVARFSLNYNVKFLGYREDIGDILHNAYAMVVPSVVEEAFGRVVIEAFACGVPVIATRVGALEEIVKDREDGLLVRPRNAQELANAVLELLNTPSLAQRIAVNARKKVENLYSFSQCISRIEKVYKETVEHKRILVIKISSLGDLILAIPSLKALKENFPDSKLVLLTLRKYVSLFYDCPYVDKVVGVDLDYKKIKQIFKIARQIRRQSFDYIIDLQNNYASHLIVFLSLPPKSFGYLRKLGFLLTHKVKYRKERISPLESQEKILKLLGVKFKEKKLAFWEVKQVSFLEDRELKKENNLIGINVSASLKWQSKNWPLSHIKKLVEIITKEYPELKIVLVGDENCKPLGKVIKTFSPRRVINLCGKTTLRDLVYLLKKLKVFITQDTATLHLASSLGVNTIALFGPTDPARHTIHSPVLQVIFKRLPCSFCYKPTCSTNTCMKEIKPQEVFAKIEEFLKR